MDIQVYEDIKEALQQYNESLDKNYGNKVVGIAPTTPTYPLTVFDEIRNISKTPLQTANSNFDTTASLGYKLEVSAKTKGNVDRQKIARIIAQKLDKFLTKYVHLEQVSWNTNDLVNDGSIYVITITYRASLYENRRRII